MTKLFCVVLFALSATGCGLHYAVPADYRPPDYGRPISQQKAEALAKWHIQKRLIYPRSAQYRFEKIYCGQRINPLEWNAKTGHKVYYGYVLVVHINARYPIGGRQESSRLFVIRDGQIVFEEWNL